MPEPRSLFRQVAVEHRSSPDQLDQLMQVVRLQNWIPLASIGFFLGLGVLWSIFGRIPTAVEARGVLLDDPQSDRLFNVSYFSIAQGKQIQPGDRVLIVPDPVSVQEAGGLEGVVRSVSPQTVTEQAVVDRVGGKPELAALIYLPAAIEVVTELQPNPATPTGYQWSTRNGSELPLTAETTATSRIILSEQAPIELLFPALGMK